MINSYLFNIVINSFLFSFFFWGLTFLFKIFYSKKNFTFKLNFYECGFKSLTNIKIQYNINFILILLFVLIYDGEFFLLIPFSINSTNVTIFSFFIIFFFLIWLVITLLIDYIYGALEWQVMVLYSLICIVCSYLKFFNNSNYFYTNLIFYILFILVIFFYDKKKKIF